MKIQKMAIENVVPYERNPRKHNDAVDKVAASLKEFGWRQPIVVDASNSIIAGHTRWLAAKQLGMKEVPVLVAADLTPAQVKAYRLADNRTHEESEWDNALLAIELGELGDFDLSLTGFDAEEIKGLMAFADSVVEGLTDKEDCPEALGSPVCKMGDVWLLGRHRLVCGNSTCMDDIDKLMAGVQADMVFTDPPYNVDYEGYTEDKLKLAYDNMGNEDYAQFLRDAFASCYLAIKKTASLYVCHPSLYQREFQDALEANHFVVRNQIVWAKNHFAWGHGRYKFQHEPIFYCYQKDAVDAWYGDKTQTTLWQINKPNANRLHPTMKPVELIQAALRNSSQAGDIVLDLFGGSGSTLIACEMLGRTAHLMELDPRYCDVIINRWQDFTGQKAVLELNKPSAARLKSSGKSPVADGSHLPLAKSNCAK